MRTMSEQEMVLALAGVPSGTPLFVSYVAGRPPTDRAIREAARSRREGIAKRHYFGTLAEVRTTKRGDAILTIVCENRDDERTGEHRAFRTFNPNLGQLLSVAVLDEGT